MGPEYTPPDTDVPDCWRSELNNGLNDGSIDTRSLAEWWKQFDDPVLSGLIEQAVAGNLDVREAEARVREARARRGAVHSGLFPSLDANASASKSGVRPPEGGSDTGELYSAGFDAGWEIDLFGRVRRSREAADANIDASREYLRQVLASLLAETALNYVETRVCQTRLDVAMDSLTSREHSTGIVRSRVEAGLSNELALQQALYSLAGVRAQIPVLETALEAAKNRLAVLLGRTPGSVHHILEEHRPVPTTPPSIAVGLPADALNQRPDVRRAERLLAAQTARIGAAQADRYPRIRLAGSIGLEALSMGDLFNHATRAWRFGPSITWPVFEAGAIRSNIEVQNALQEQALRQYEKTILSALEEVENGLTAYALEQVRRDALMEAMTASRSAAMLAEDQYKAGLTDFGAVLEAQRSMLSFQDQLAQSDGNIAVHLIRLYKSLGGGWTSLAGTVSVSTTSDVDGK